MIRVEIELSSISPPGERLAEVTTAVGRFLSTFDGRDVVITRAMVEETDD